MNNNYQVDKFRALEFAARFGFITRALFFEYLCSFQRSLQYRFWAQLQKEGLIAPAKTNGEGFYLTKNGRASCRGKAIPARSIYFIEHDTLVAELLLVIQQSGLVLRYWTERDLKSDFQLSYEVLGSERVSKYPDLVLDMKSANGSLKIAIEVERSQKSRDRYNQLAMSCVGANRIGLFVFACENKAVSAAIARAFQGEYFERAAKIPATLLLSDFAKQRSDTVVSFMDRRLTLKKLLLAALRLPDSQWPNSVDNPWKVVHGLSTATKEAA